MYGWAGLRIRFPNDVIKNDLSCFLVRHRRVIKNDPACSLALFARCARPARLLRPPLAIENRRAEDGGLAPHFFFSPPLTATYM